MAILVLFFGCFGLVLKSTTNKRSIHRTVKIWSFSLLRKSVDRYEGGDFEAGGYNWKLVLYPNRNKERKVEGHISLYLELAEEKPIKHGQIEKKYIFYRTIVGGPAGFDHFISLEEFTDAFNGYVIDDTCEFGAEVFVSEQARTGKGDCQISMIEDVAMFKHTWMISNFSQLGDKCCASKPIVSANHKYCAW
ncbi:uncharacterized protein LOC126797154 [Argentina anserina]|uniref:uncharacterized protein LOC126797154 n=1 Tax=Argentina anserina TaxID=57926 RepID=UPI002176529F|nr:uncharacterized protein LOC126797154 [Potentilla anserina]